jgi:hypothetical protein
MSVNRLALTGQTSFKTPVKPYVSGMDRTAGVATGPQPHSLAFFRIFSCTRSMTLILAFTLPSGLIS